MSKLNYKPKIITQTSINNITTKNKKRASSQIKYQKAPDIMTQAKPAYLNNFVRPINPHQSAFTPTNRSKNLEQKNLLLPQKTSEFSDKKTLILDLDETLVHSSFVPFENNDIILNVDFESVMYNIYVLVRPGAEEFIKKVSKLYEVIIFTASIAKYALPLLDILDNEKK
jgi:predicted secreted acid phosphatase